MPPRAADPGLPRRLILTKARERQVLQRLSAFPSAAPEIVIRPGHFEPFAVELCEDPLHPIQLELGATGAYADYDARQRRMLAAVFLQVPRRVRVKGVPCFEVYETGATHCQERLRIDWHGPAWYGRVGRENFRCSDSIFSVVRSGTVPSPSPIDGWPRTRFRALAERTPKSPTRACKV